VKTIGLLLALGAGALNGIVVVTTLPAFDVAVLTGSLMPKLGLSAESNMQNIDFRNIDFSRPGLQQVISITHRGGPGACGCVLRPRSEISVEDQAITSNILRPMRAAWVPQAAGKRAIAKLNKRLVDRRDGPLK
jgi:hypothetical protein